MRAALPDLFSIKTRQTSPMGLLLAICSQWLGLGDWISWGHMIDACLKDNP